MQAARALLENPDEPVSELTYYGCIDATTQNIKVQIWHRSFLQAANVFYIDLLSWWSCTQRKYMSYLLIHT